MIKKTRSPFRHSRLFITALFLSSITHAAPPLVSTLDSYSVIDSDNDGIQNVALQGSANDPDGGIVDWYVWIDADTKKQYAKGKKANVSDVKFSVGTHYIKLKAKDDQKEWGNSGKIMITVKPGRDDEGELTPRPGGPYCMHDHDANGTEVVTLDGSSSTPANNIEHYQWKCNCPAHAGETIAWTKSPTVNVELTQGTHEVTLILQDKSNEWSKISEPVTVLIDSSEQTNQKPAPCFSDNSGKYNVLFIAIDDLRTEIKTYNPKLLVKTPNIDKFASESMLFERAYCQQSVCTASRASLLAGARPNTTKVTKITEHLRKKMPNAYTLPRIFRDHGYTSIGLDKIFHHYCEDDAESWSQPAWKSQRHLHQDKQSVKINGKMPATERGDDPEITDESYQDGDTKDKAIELLRKYKASGEKFFLAIGFNRPHLPFSAPAKYWDLYNRNNIYNARYTKWPIGMPEHASTHWPELGSYGDTLEYVYNEKRNPNPPPMPDSKIKELIHGYYACVSFSDAMLGQVLTELDRLGLRENTIVVLWGDHGWKLNDYGAWSKQTNFEIDNRVPLIIDVPGYKNGRTKALVELVDIYPTLVELCGLNYTASYELEGTSMVPVLKEPNISWKKAAFSQYQRGIHVGKWYKAGMGYSIRSGDWRYTEWWLDKGKTFHSNELYLHVGDDEIVSGKNVVQDYPEVVEKMKNLLNRKTGDTTKPGEGWKTIQKELKQTAF